MKLGFIIQHTRYEEAPTYVWLKKLIVLHKQNNFKSIPYHTIVPFILWHLWTTRNKNYFDNVKQIPQTSIIYHMASEFHYLTNANNARKSIIPLHLKWEPPTQRVFKLNTDGAMRLSNPLTGFGGVIRDYKGTG